jgi:hypothetical protein
MAAMARVERDQLRTRDRFGRRLDGLSALAGLATCPRRTRTEQQEGSRYQHRTTVHEILVAFSIDYFNFFNFNLLIVAGRGTPYLAFREQSPSFVARL